MENADLLDLVKLLRDHDVASFRMGNIAIIFKGASPAQAKTAVTDPEDDELAKLERLAADLQRRDPLL